MNKKGLLVEPDFFNVKRYLQSGSKTEISDYLYSISQNISGNTTGLLVRNLLVWMNKNTRRLHIPNDSRKFKRNATEILKSRERTGCCDSSTLFSTLARCKGIPTMQIITFNKSWGNQINSNYTDGHFFVACYLKDKFGKFDWILIDSDQPAYDIADIRLYHFNKEDRNILSNFYAFAYVNDYSDVVYNNIKIDSINNIAKIQRIAFLNCDKNDILYNNEKEK